MNEAMEFMKEQKGETNGARQTMKGIERLLSKADQKVTDLDRRRLQEAQATEALMSARTTAAKKGIADTLEAGEDAKAAAENEEKKFISNTASELKLEGENDVEEYRGKSADGIRELKVIKDTSE